MSCVSSWVEESGRKMIQQSIRAARCEAFRIVQRRLKTHKARRRSKKSSQRRDGLIIADCVESSRSASFSTVCMRLEVSKESLGVSVCLSDNTLQDGAPPVASLQVRWSKSSKDFTKPTAKVGFRDRFTLKRTETRGSL